MSNDHDIRISTCVASWAVRAARLSRSAAIPFAAAACLSLTAAARPDYSTTFTGLSTTTTAGNFDVEFANEPFGGTAYWRVKITDKNNNRVLASRGGLPVLNNSYTDLHASVSAEAADDGITLHYSFYNSSGSPQHVPQMWLVHFLPGNENICVRRNGNAGGHMLGSLDCDLQFTMEDLPLLDPESEEFESRPVPRNHTGIGYYPGAVYSPIAVFGDSSYTIGVSLNYPAVKYDHHVGIDVRSDAHVGASELGWDVAFYTYGNGGPEAFVPAGATYTYDVAIRVLRSDIDSTDWLGAITPYRDYFRATYGGPKYVRDTRPVRGLPLAFVERIDGSNPRGFDTDIGRPDTDTSGYASIIDEIGSRVQGLGYERSMLWAISGVHGTGRDYPSNIFSGMVNDPEATDLLHMASTKSSLADLVNYDSATADVGYWWGRCTTVMPVWNSGTGDHDIDIEDSSDQAWAFGELDAAVAVGAKAIGLDAYAATFPYSPAKQYKWVQRLQAHQPGVRFITEALASDFLHTLAPTFIDDGYADDTPNSLIDFILPGHETWLQGLSLADYPAETYCQQRDLIEKIASLGYVPCTGFQVTTTSGMIAVDSWEDSDSVPTGLQLGPAGFNNVLKCNPADIVSAGGELLPDGQLTIEDYLAFLAAYGDDDLLADIATASEEPYPDHQLTIEDYLLFLSAFGDGCP